MIRLRCEVPGGVHIPLVLPVRQITSLTITVITELLKGRFTQSSGSQKWLKVVFLQLVDVIMEAFYLGLSKSKFAGCCFFIIVP